MSELKDVVYYICQNYPIKSELSKARLTKLVYLADWEYCVEKGQQMTGIKWYFHNFGPYVDDVIAVARKENIFHVEQTKNTYGDVKELISVSDSSFIPNLYDDEKSIIDVVIRDTKSMYWKRFIEHVYATKPIKTSDRYSELDLIAISKNSRGEPRIEG